jgi:hypothetical protein
VVAFPPFISAVYISELKGAPRWRVMKLHLELRIVGLAVPELRIELLSIMGIKKDGKLVLYK